MKNVAIKNTSLVLPGVFSTRDLVKKISLGEKVDRCLPVSRLEGFNPKDHLSDRRILKAVSERDTYGLAAVEAIKKKSDKWSDVDPESRGVFVGACPSSVVDNENYIPAIKASVDASGQYVESRFGGECMNSRPTTLLLGLPNNVLCYGSLILDARGPNNNFTSGGTSSMMALSSAMRSFDRGRIRRAVAGGYAYNSDPVRRATYQHLDITKPEKGVVFTDGAGFAEVCESANESGLNLISMSFATSDSFGSSNFEDAIFKSFDALLSKNGLMAEDIKSVFVPFESWTKPDSSYYHKFRSAFLSESTGLYSLEGYVGYPDEVSGIAELALLEHMTKGQTIPWAHLGEMPAVKLSSDKRGYHIVLTTNFEGDIAAALLSCESR